MGATLAILLVLGIAPAASAAGSAPNRATTGVTDATATWLEGIDVSHWQGTINWTKVAAAGKKFAIIKATDSTSYIDPMYATNHAQARAAGLWTGAYHFAKPDATAGDAVKEADHFASHISLGAGDLIPALDLEVSGGLSVAALQKWVASFLTEVTAKTGVKPMIYTSPAFWRRYMGDSSALADAGYKTLWVAHWGVSAPAVPASNWGGKGWTFWQYTSDGTVSGIVGRVDLDRFNGLDLAPQAFSAFSLAASLASGSIKQGESSAASVAIKRINFTSEVALDISGLPDGTTATWEVNPTTHTVSALTVTTAADPAATAVGTYPLTVTGVADGLTRTTKLNLLIADGIAPTVKAPVTSLVANRTLGTSTVPVRVTWSATDPSGISANALQRSINGGTWSTIALPTPTTTASDVSLPLSGTGQQRVRSTDRVANTSVWLRGPVVRTLLSQQSGPSITYSGTWHASTSSAWSGGSTRYATSAGASATYSFSGSSVAWVAARGSTRGSAKVYVDGVYAATVSLHSTTGQSRAIVFARNWPTVGAHKLEIVVVGTAGHPRVDVDAFVRLAIS
ncbi:MAG: glycoside hydrolase family 25 protein [Chloroflexi bacterium]|nr:glycoside hydrolase family 25 protein [Chloroflexota bacterium]